MQVNYTEIQADLHFRQAVQWIPSLCCKNVFSVVIINCATKCTQNPFSSFDPFKWLKTVTFTTAWFSGFPSCTFVTYITVNILQLSSTNMTSDYNPVAHPSCHIFLTHLFDLSPLPASEPDAVTPSITLKLSQKDAKRWPPAFLPQSGAVPGLLPGCFFFSLFCCKTPDVLKSVTAALLPASLPPQSQAVITQRHAPGPRAADWSLSDVWQEKLSEGIKYSHTAVRRSRGNVWRH